MLHLSSSKTRSRSSIGKPKALFGPGHIPHKERMRCVVAASDECRVTGCALHNQPLLDLHGTIDQVCCRPRAELHLLLAGCCCIQLCCCTPIKLCCCNASGQDRSRNQCKQKHPLVHLLPRNYIERWHGLPNSGQRTTRTERNLGWCFTADCVLITHLMRLISGLDTPPH